MAFFRYLFAIAALPRFDFTRKTLSCKPSSICPDGF
jgi:hypothetical protein